MPSRLRVVALDEAEALGGTVPWNRLAHDGDKVGLLVLPVPQVAAVDANRDRRRGHGQAGTRIGAAGEREDGLGAEFRLEMTGDPQCVPMDCHGVEGRIDGQKVA